MPKQKQLSYQAFLHLNYEQMQDAISQLESSTDPDIQSLVTSLKELTPEDLAPVSGDIELFKLREDLQSDNYFESPAELDQYMIEISRAAISQSIVDIIEAMNEKSKHDWDQLMETEPNMMQIAFLLDGISQLLLRQTFDELYNKHIEKIISIIRDSINNNETLVAKVSNLDQDQVAKIQNVLDLGYGNLANNLLKEYSDAASN